jgi:SAM-dependent methyltransferase
MIHLEALVRRGLARARRALPARRLGAQTDPHPWRPASDPWGEARDARPGAATVLAAARCNICRWHGDRFEGTAHSESAVCPRCGSIARDRFLFFCLQARTVRPRDRLRLLETSPRMGASYRRTMAGWFDYLCSDFDERAHAGMLRLDLQAIDLPDASIDVVLTPHVLEHVPDTDKALGELHRVIAPGGRMFLQVPVLQGRTTPPAGPEFHGDRTPVFWRFGFDLTDRLRAHGFETVLLATAALRRLACSGSWDGPVSPEFDLADILVEASHHELVVVADDQDADRHGFHPSYMFLTWDCRKPA